MKIIKGKVQGNEYEAVIYPVFKSEIAESMGSFKGEENQVFYTTSYINKLRFNVYVGLGEEEDFNEDILRNSIALAAREVKKLKLKKAAIKCIDLSAISLNSKIRSIVEGTILSLYRYTKFKTNNKVDDSIEFDIFNIEDEDVDKANLMLEETMKIVNSVILTRDLTNEPANYLYPETLAERAKDIFKDTNVEVKIYTDEECEAMGMDAFISVGKGSDKKPRLIVMKYMGELSSNEVVGLIGKGVTYDSGGYSIKPTSSMVEMHGDMGGAATVIGAIKALADNNVRKNIIAVVAACENLISGGSYKPGDIIGSMAGKTIEVMNTDAEGRLTLIDAVTYAIAKEKVTRVIDVATLTGAAITALGEDTTLVLSNNDEYYNKLMVSSEGTGEKFWRMPMFKEYKRLYKGTNADLKNTGGKNAGAIAAGMFIGEFVQDKPWMHLDIAGTAYTNSPVKNYITKGATGETVRTLYNLLKR